MACRQVDKFSPLLLQTYRKKRESCSPQEGREVWPFPHFESASVLQFVLLYVIPLRPGKVRFILKALGLPALELDQ